MSGLEFLACNCHEPVPGLKLHDRSCPLEELRRFRLRERRLVDVWHKLGNNVLKPNFRLDRRKMP